MCGNPFTASSGLLLRAGLRHLFVVALSVFLPVLCGPTDLRPPLALPAAAGEIISQQMFSLLWRHVII
jgi:hypothetical protein